MQYNMSPRQLAVPISINEFTYADQHNISCICCQRRLKNSDSKVHGANMGPTRGRQDPGGPHVGHMKIAIWLSVIAHETQTWRLDWNRLRWIEE